MLVVDRHLQKSYTRGYRHFSVVRRGPQATRCAGADPEFAKRGPSQAYNGCLGAEVVGLGVRGESFSSIFIQKGQKFSI